MPGGLVWQHDRSLALRVVRRGKVPRCAILMMFVAESTLISDCSIVFVAFALSSILYLPSFQPATGMSACANCQAGSFSSDAGKQVCDQCLAGSFSNVAGTSACAQCAAGTFSAAGASVCSACGIGQVGYFFALLFVDCV